MVESIDPVKSSVFLAALRAARRLTFRARPLHDREVRALEGHGCRCEDWDRIRVADGFSPERVREVRFRGRVILGKQFGWVNVAGSREPAGIERTTLEETWVEDGVVIRDTHLVSRMRVGHGVAIIGCGGITHQVGSHFGVGTPIALIETGGRVTRFFPEMTLDQAARSARPSGNLRALAAYLRKVEAYLARARSDYGVIQAHARILYTPRVENTFIGASARIEGATRLSECVVLSEPSHPTVIEDGAMLTESGVQWGCSVGSLSVVEKSLLCEHSRVERHAKVLQSVIGPNTAIAEGEVSSSLIGPFVGFHHQALLIGVVWPEGKGNVGHGCNCGSNHTGKAPDQEFWPGEGMFLGLGVNVKFPGCFTEAPYSFIATGTVLPPQRVACPFSLITPPTQYPPEIQTGLNEIVPGWVLEHNLFALLRSEEKFAARDRSFRSRLEHRVFHREVIERMMAARGRLAKVSAKEIYRDAEVEGLGENFMTEKSRRRALETYTFHIQLFALEGVYSRCLSRGKVSPAMIRRPSTDPEWEFRRSLIHSEGLRSSPCELLRQYVERMKTVARRIEESKSRDDLRGARIIPDYADHHLPASENRFVRAFQDRVAEIEDNTLDLLEG